MSARITNKTSLAELCAIVCEALSQGGIKAFLSGGAVVSIYTENKYQSYDLDFVTHADRSKIKKVMEALGFKQDKSRLYSHPNTQFMVEFPGAAMMVGDQPVTQFAEVKFQNGKLRLLTPTDCIKDRLAAYYHWNDRQGLNQAIAVAKAQSIKLEEIKTWSIREGMKDKLQDFLDGLKERRGP